MRDLRISLESFSMERDKASYDFTGLVEVIAAYSLKEVLPALGRVDAAVYAGCHAAGFISYEAAPGLNQDLAAFPPGEFPLLWFGIFTKRMAVRPPSVEEVKAS